MGLGWKTNGTTWLALGLGLGLELGLGLGLGLETHGATFSLSTRTCSPG